MLRPDRPASKSEVLKYDKELLRYPSKEPLGLIDNRYTNRGIKSDVNAIIKP